MPVRLPARVVSHTAPAGLALRSPSTSLLSRVSEFVRLHLAAACDVRKAAALPVLVQPPPPPPTPTRWVASRARVSYPRRRPRWGCAAASDKVLSFSCSLSLSLAAIDSQQQQPSAYLRDARTAFFTSSDPRCSVPYHLHQYTYFGDISPTTLQGDFHWRIQNGLSGHAPYSGAIHNCVTPFVRYTPFNYVHFKNHWRTKNSYCSNRWSKFNLMLYS